MANVAGFSKRLRVAGKMVKVTREILQCISTGTLHTFREAGAFIRVTGEL